MFRHVIAGVVLLVGVSALAGCATPASNVQTAPAAGTKIDIAALTEKAMGGNIEAQYALGILYVRGEGGLPQRPSEGAKWLARAGDQNHRKAQLALLYMYYKGSGVSQNYTEALKWARKTAEQGDAGAMVVVGEFYQKGYGTSQNYNEAANWYRRAADKGDARGQTSLAALHVTGRGVARDYDEALRLFRLAADQNHAPAQNGLGFLHASGVGVKKDPVAAYMWYTIGTGHPGKPDNKEVLAQKSAIEAKLTSAQIDEARRQANQWRAKLLPPKATTD